MTCGVVSPQEAIITDREETLHEISSYDGTYRPYRASGYHRVPTQANHSNESVWKMNMEQEPFLDGFCGGLHRRIWDEDGIPFRAIRGSFEKVRGEQSRSSHRQLSLSRLGYGMDDTHQSGQMREKPGAALAGCRYQPLLAMDMWVESKNLSRISTALEPL